jgi:cobalamin biosynthetic protein CobC
MLEHGGKLRAAAQDWHIPLGEWLDLSTGIAPWAYPVPAIPAEVWQRLPEDDDGLETAAQAYYGAPHLLLLSGSQAGIQTLPRLFPRGRVAIPAPIYNEHPGAWRAAGHELVGWDAPADYAVVCNPTNPTGQRYSTDELLARARSLRLLVVDEAFLDTESGQSMIGCGAANVVVLRSLGKFFGLAGARVGCAIAAPELLARLAESLGPWAVANPARWAARHALADRVWQAVQRGRLREASHRLAELLRASGLGEPTGTALFQYLATPRAPAIFESLAKRGILVRLFAEPAALRFGLPANEDEWQRLTLALKEIP